MLTTNAAPTKVPANAFEREVYEWACKHWPDVRYTWAEHRDYYLREWHKQMASNMCRGW